MTTISELGTYLALEKAAAGPALASGSGPLTPMATVNGNRDRPNSTVSSAER